MCLWCVLQARTVTQLRSKQNTLEKEENNRTQLKEKIASLRDPVSLSNTGSAPINLKFKDNGVKDSECIPVSQPVLATTPILQATSDAEQGRRGRLHSIMKKTQDLVGGQINRVCRQMTGLASNPGSFLSGLQDSMERLRIQDNRVESQIASFVFLSMLPQQPLPVEAPSPVLSSLRGSIESLGIQDTTVECKLVCFALLALLPKQVEQPGKNPTKKYPRTFRPPKITIKGARSRRKERTEPRKEMQRSARDGNIGGDWGSKQSRDAKLAKAMKSEKMATRHTFTNLCSSLLPLLCKVKTAIAEMVEDVLLDSSESENHVSVDYQSSKPQVSFVFGIWKERTSATTVFPSRVYAHPRRSHVCARAHSTHTHILPPNPPPPPTHTRTRTMYVSYKYII